MTITTVRPSSTVAAPAPWALFGAASHHAAHADASDATLSEATAGNSAALVMELGDIAAPAANQRIAQCRFRLRAKAINQTAADLRVRPYDPTTGKFGAEDRWTTIPQTYTDLVGAWRGFDPGPAEWTAAVVNRIRESLANYSSTWSVDVAASYFDVDVRTRPTAAVTAPTGVVSTTTQPTVTITYTDVDGDPAVAAHVFVYSAAEYGAAGFVPGQRPTYGLDPAQTVGPCTWYKDVGAFSGGSVNVPVEVPLVNGTSYRAYAIVGKSFTTGVWFSDFAFSAFTITLTPPTAPTSAVTYDAVNHAYSLAVSTAAPPAGATAYSAAVYRRVGSIEGGGFAGPETYDLIYTVALPLAAGTPAFTFVDRTPPRNRSVLYRLRVTATVGGSPVSSNNADTATFLVAPDKRWLLKTVSPVDGTGTNWVDANVREAPGVTVTEAQGVFRPLGRRTAVVVSSGVRGEDGGYVITVRGVAAWATARAVLTSTDPVWVSDPFGGNKFVRFTTRDWDLLGTLAAPRRPVTVSYVEVDDPRAAVT